MPPAIADYHNIAGPYVRMGEPVAASTLGGAEYPPPREGETDAAELARRPGRCVAKPALRCSQVQESGFDQLDLSLSQRARCRAK